MIDKRLIGERFELGPMVGEGGMGAVYRGLDRTTGAVVAIKSLKPEVIANEPEILRRFDREGEILRKLNHPNIVKVLATLTEHDQHFLVTDYVAGGSLRDLLEREKCLSVARTLEIMLDLCDALTRAHRLKIIHRDIKPANILLAEDGTPLLSDFGVAHSGDAPSMTETGSIVGTLQYLSPEACQGKQQDQRADIWALGITLYEMLVGQRPFVGDNPAVMLDHILHTPAPDVCQQRPDVPPALGHLLARMLAKDPAQRIGSMRLVSAQLEAVQTGQPIPPEDTPTPMPAPAAATPTPAQTGRLLDGPTITPLYIKRLLTPPPSAAAVLPAAAPLRTRRRWGVWLALLAGSLLLVGSVAALLITGSGAPVTLDCARAPDERLVLVADLEPLGTAERDVSRFIVADLHDRLTASVPFSTMRVCHYPRILTSSAQALQVAEKYRASVMVWGNYTPDFIELAVEIGVTDGFTHIVIARDRIEVLGNIRVRLTNERTQSIAPQVLGAWVAFQNADGDGYEAMRSFAILQQIPDTGVEIMGDSPAAHGQRYFANYIRNPAYALEEITQSLELDRNPLQYMSRSGLLLRLGRVELARRDAQTALRLGPAGWALPYYVMANIELAEGDFATAIGYYDQIIALRPNDWFPINLRGGIYYLQGDYAAAEADLARAIALTPNVNFPYMLQFMLHLRAGDLLAAQATMQTILTQFPDPSFGNRIVDATFGEEFPIIFAPVFSGFGNMILGEYEQVLLNAARALAINPAIADLYIMQGFAYCNLRDYAAAETAYSAAITREPELVTAYLLRAEVRLKQGNILGATADTAAVLGSPQRTKWQPVIRASQSGAITCENLLEVDLSALLAP